MTLINSPLKDLGATHVKNPSYLRDINIGRRIYTCLPMFRCISARDVLGD